MSGDYINSIIDNVLSQYDDEENDDDIDFEDEDVGATETVELDLDGDDAGDDLDDLFD